MVVTIASTMLADLRRRAAATPDEICGLLLGPGERIDAVLPCRNVAADPRHRFEIDPAALIAAHRRARAGGPALIGCYHSHPAGDAQPSLADAADAHPNGWWWLILGAQEPRLFRAVAAGPIHGRFEEHRLRLR